MNVMAWKAWYTGGRNFCSDGMPFEDLPRDECLGFMLLMDEVTDGGVRYRRHMSGSSWYWMWDGPQGEVYGEGDEGDVEERYPGAVVIRGKWTTETEFARPQKAAMDWYGNLGTDK